MKKLFFFAIFALAIASFGSNAILAHAQTAPAGSVSTATLQQELQVAKAALVNLEMKAGMVPVGDSGLPAAPATQAPTVSTVAPAPATGLSDVDRAALQSTLGALVSALSSLNATLAANPQAVASHEQAIALLLNGMRGTVASMGTALNGGNTPIASVAPSAPATTGDTNTAPAAQASAPIASNPAPIATTQPAPSIGSLAPTAAPAGTNSNQPQPQTAQASNAWSFVTDHWPTITIVILVALILLILFWPSNEEEGKKHEVRAPVKPETPSRPITVSTIVSPPDKVTVIRPQDQQRKTA